MVDYVNKHDSIPLDQFDSDVRDMGAPGFGVSSLDLVVALEEQGTVRYDREKEVLFREGL